MRRRLLPLLACTVALAGCLPPRPPIPTAAAVTPPSAWRGETAGQTTGQTTGQTPAPAATGADWWRSFGDANLDAMVQRALDRNADVGSAAAAVAEARARLHLARANRGPEVDVANIGGYTRQLEVTGPITTPGAEPEATIAYDLDLFGRLASASKAAKAALLASKASHDAVALSTAATTASGYITLLGLDERLRIAQATVTARADQLRVQQRLTGRGYASQLELHQAQAEYQSALDLVPQLQLAIAQQEDALSILLGDAPAPVGRAGSTLAQVQAPPIPAGLPSELLRRRPDIYAAEEAVVAADRSLDSARADMLPRFALTGSVGGVFAEVLPNPVNIFLIGSSALAPIFDSGRRRAAADVAAARRDEAAFAYRSTALNAFREVDDALAAIQRLDERRRGLQAEVEANAQALRVATERYRAGYTPYIDQIDAQRSLLSAQLSLAQVETDRLLAYVTLYEAMGGGWTPAGPEPAGPSAVPAS